jgi:hypothetical protein
MSLPHDDRRAHPRYELMAQVRVKRGQVDYVLDLANISRGGAMFSSGSLKLPPWAAVGRKLEISIIHPVSLDSVDVQGEIVRVVGTATDTKLAVRFVELGAAAQTQIDALVELAAQRAPSEAPPPPPGSDAKKGPPPLP